MERKKLAPADSKTFCVLPWIHSHFTTDGMTTVCCISPDPIPASDYGQLRVQRHSLAEMFHSPQMDEIRRKLLEGKPVKNCSACYVAERFRRSMRQHYNDLWQRKIPGLYDRIAERQEKAAFDKPLSADVRFGNLCNLRCQICNARNSSQIERDEPLARWSAAPYQRVADSENRFGPGMEWYESTDFEDELIEFTSDLRYITLGGGEPSIAKGAMKWLQRLLDSGQAAEIELSISTNLTNVNPRFYELAAQFGRVRFNLSIDGFGPFNEYLRYPSKWRVVECNADHLAALRDKGGDIVIDVTPVISAYNALSIVHLFEWADAKGFGIAANQVRGVEHIDCSLIPPEALALAAERMRTFLREAKNTKTVYATIEEIAGYLENTSSRDAVDQREKFRRFTWELDHSRGMRFEDYAPEMARFLDYRSGSNAYT